MTEKFRNYLSNDFRWKEGEVENLNQVYDILKALEPTGCHFSYIAERSNLFEEKNKNPVENIGELERRVNVLMKLRIAEYTSNGRIHLTETGKIYSESKK